MKTLTLFLLLSLPSFAGVDFSIERTTPLGTDRFELKDSNGNILVKKTSNWFDRKLDLRLGAFKPQNPAPLKTLAGELEKIEKDIKAADERLAAYGSGFNELNNNSEPHAPYFRVNGFKVQKGSILYPRLEEIVAKIQATPLALDEGVELDKTRKNYIFYKNGKEVSREPFNARFFCELPRFPTRCMARQWGAFYLE